MPDYAYNLVYKLDGRDVVEQHYTPHAFAGTPEDFGRVTLVDLIARIPAAGNDFAGVNVWHSDREGVGVPARRAALVSTLDLDPGPFPPNQLEINHYTYYVAAGDHDITTDDVLGGYGTDVRFTVPHGLIVPGSGPALKIRTGHQYGYITLDVRALESGPAADLAAWEAIEQATITPQTDVDIFDWLLSYQEQFPDLTGGRRAEYLTIRVSARGRDAKAVHRPGVHPRRVPLEHHLIEAWPASAPAPREVLERDQTTREWENSTAG